MKISRILHISDLHLGPKETILGIDPSVYIAQFFAEVIDRRISIDCCLVTGDIAHGGELEAYARLRRLLNSCPWPTRVLPGNHDDVKQGRDVLGQDYWPSEDVWAWEIDGGSTIVGISSNVPGHNHGEVTEASLVKLDQLAVHAHTKGAWLLALHHPPCDVGHWWMDAQGLLTGKERVLDIANRNKAAAILCGHIHMNAMVHQREGTPIIVAPSMVHEVVYDDAVERPLRFRRRSPRALLHHLNLDRLVTVELTTGGSSWLVEGKPWNDEVDRSNRRLPAIR